MSILIRGMEMIPNTCKECFIGNPKNKTCYILGLPKRNLEVREDCPLIEVPPHGRLIDADALMTEVMDSDLDHLQRDDWKEVIQIVSDAEVVIEAEGGE